jgi:hypothetical protein
MSQKTISMLIIRTMLQLLLRSGSERSIAAELNMSRNTLRKYDAAFKASPYSYRELSPAGLLILIKHTKYFGVLGQDKRSSIIDTRVFASNSALYLIPFLLADNIVGKASTVYHC